MKLAKKALLFSLVIALVLSFTATSFADHPNVKPIKSDKFSAATIKAASSSLAIQSGNTIVYITNTGKKYHRGSCRYLKQSKIKIKLSKAKARGYTPCKVCKPPTK